MRILKVTQSYLPFLEKGGPAVKIPALAGWLVKRGHQVSVLTVAHDTSYANQVRQIGGVEVSYLRVILAYRSTSLNAGVLSFCRQRLRSFDVVHIYGLYDLLGPVVASYCRRWNVPYILEPMGMYRPIVRSLVKKHVYHWLFGGSLARGAQQVIATSQQERTELLQEGVAEKHICVRRNGIDLDEFMNLPGRGAFRCELGLPDNAPLFLFVGRLSAKKGLDLLLKAFSSLPEEAFLVIMGPDERDGTTREVERLRREGKLQNRVRVLGPRYAQQKLAAMVDADVFVLPSRNENFGNAVAEAIACGTPVLITDRCGIAPLVAERAGIVVSCEEGALRDGLSRLLRDAALRERLRAGCAATAQALSWEEPVCQMEALYQKVAAAGGPQ